MRNERNDSEGPAVAWVRSKAQHVAKRLCLASDCLGYEAEFQDILQDALADAYLVGREAAYDECGVIRGEDARAILQQLDRAVNPEEAKRRVRFAIAWSDWISRDPGTRGPEPEY